MKQHNRKIIYLTGFLFSIPIALSAYINSSFISSFIGEKYVGLVYTFASLTSILGLLISPVIFRKIGGYKFILGIALLDALCFALLSLTERAYVAVIIFILNLCLNTLIVFSLDELLKISSRDSATGNIRGFYIAFCNLAWIIAQILSGTILGGFSFEIIYFLNFFIMILFLCVLTFNLRHISEPEYDKRNILKYVGEFFKNKKLFHAYMINFLLQFFFSWMIIYTPIYLSSYLGFSWKEIGIIFAIMLIPFSVIPIPLGKYGDKFGERKILMFAFAIIAFTTMSLFFVKGHDLFIWAALLFMTRVGAASIEVMSDSYFFRHIKSANDEYVGVYRSISPVAFIIGPLIASLFFIFIPSFKFIYLILGIIMLFGIYLSSMIKKSDL